MRKDLQLSAPTSLNRGIRLEEPRHPSAHLLSARDEVGGVRGGLERPLTWKQLGPACTAAKHALLV
ncbi:MAG: hypothetical protein JO183_04475 [Ktedonobacteraceae bacterium]|nr:hypothetical protein [Ktedonobacteraceae bacterium]MBV9019702.1 hypothetical protein [Ktedonobacteraceae bacterium]